MKNVLAISDIEQYMAYKAEKVAQIKNVKTESEFGKIAQHIDFCKFVDPDGNSHYYISIVHRGHISDYSHKKTWLENRYSVTKEEGNKLYLDAKQGKTILIVD